MAVQQPRVEIFLDQSNFYNGLLKQFGDGHFRLDKLVHRILDGRQLAKLNIYTGMIDAGREPQKACAQQSFFRAISHLPFTTQLFSEPLRYYPNWPSVPPKEKGVDARIVQDLIIGAVDKTYDVAVLLSGDTDFCEVCRLLHSRFLVRLETYYPSSRRHLFQSSYPYFTHAEVINKKFYESIQ